MGAATFTPGIRVDGVWKRFKRGHFHDSLRDLIPAIAQRLTGRGRSEETLSEKEFWALSDVSFAVEPGDAVGIIGHNGAGKSTLLKIVNQIIRPTRGYTEVRGRIGSLIEVAAGFHPDLTGRQNVFLQGAIIGMRNAEIARKFDQIVEFAGIEKFIDTPVKRYSSGMNARLGFAIAAHLDTEVLVIDEVLAVGDLSFQDRAFGRVKEMSRSGIPVVLVTHQLERMTTLCTRAMLLDGGRVAMAGTPEECVSAYTTAVMHQRDRGAHLPFRIDALEVLTDTPVPSGDRVVVRMRGVIDGLTPPTYDVRVSVRSGRSGNIVFSTLGVNCGVGELGAGEFTIDIGLQLNVGMGVYAIETAVHDTTRRQDVAAGPTAHVRVAQSAAFTGSIQMNPTMQVVRRASQGVAPRSIPRLSIAADG